MLRALEDHLEGPLHFNTSQEEKEPEEYLSFADLAITILSKKFSI